MARYASFHIRDRRAHSPTFRAKTQNSLPKTWHKSFADASPSILREQQAFMMGFGSGRWGNRCNLAPVVEMKLSCGFFWSLWKHSKNLFHRYKIRFFLGHAFTLLGEIAGIFAIVASTTVTLHSAIKVDCKTFIYVTTNHEITCHLEAALTILSLGNESHWVQERLKVPESFSNARLAGHLGARL